MSDDVPPRTELAKALAAEQERDGPGSTEAQALGALIAHEQAAERRVERVALRAWLAAAGLVPLLAVSIFLVRLVADGWTRSAVRGAALVVGVAALLAIFVALLATTAWLFRSRRTASLTVIERRLAALESLLRQRR
jgi:uncharacterized membrane protein